MRSVAWPGRRLIAFWRAPARPGEVCWLTESEIGERLRDLREDSTSWLGRSFTSPFGLAGARAETALLCKDGR
ncbi:MAG: hypothetical protein ACYCST_10675 [Acidimicrobiales bacterium]